MKIYSFVLNVIILSFVYMTTKGQTFVALDEISPPNEVEYIYDQAVLEDEYSNAHMIWAAKGFKKDRKGAPVYEQIFVIKGKAKFTFENKENVVSRGSWIAIPPNTPHTIEVLEEETLKMFAIQRKELQEVN